VLTVESESMYPLRTLVKPAEQKWGSGALGLTGSY
jgi:hypothetical protein